MAGNVEGKLYESITGQLFEIGRQLRQRGGYPFDPKELQKYLQNAVEGKFGIGSTEKSGVVNPFALLKYTCDLVDGNKYLELISGSETLIIDKCDGKRIIPEATDVFVFIDQYFHIWKANEAGHATPDMPVRVCRQKTGGTYADIFGSISRDEEKLCLTQDQIINFVIKYPRWIRADGKGTFFMFKSYGAFFVANVCSSLSDEFRVYVSKPGSNCHWTPEYHNHFVVPQIVV